MVVSLNQALERVLRVLKSRKVDHSTSDSELASITGLSRQTIIKSKQSIKAYLKSAPNPSASDASKVDERLLSHYVNIALSKGTQAQQFSRLAGAVAGFVLRHHGNLLDDVQTTKKVVRAGQEYLSLVVQVESRKGGGGTPIHSQSKAAKYLQNELKGSTLMSVLFEKSNSYRADAYSKLWKLKPRAEKLNELIRKETLQLIVDFNATQPRFTNSLLHTGKAAKTLPLEDRYFEISVNDLQSLTLRSFLQIMSIAEPSPPDCVAVPLKNLANVDPDKGRTYNIFTRLRSNERKALGYHNYDISGGLQIICFNILTHFSQSRYPEFDNLHAAYPVIFSYGFEPVAKQKLREEIAKDLGLSIDEVKQLLTAYSNGSQKSVGNSTKLKEFFEQSDQLRREVIAVIEEQKPKVFKAAIAQSNKEFPEDIDWQSIEKEDSAAEARNKASVFFFIWTYFEKQVRDAMLSVVDDGIPVHDAIYSKEELPFSDFEDAILQQTGFEMKISD